PGAILGRLRHELSARALPVSRVAAAFGLSRSEARLAAALADGLSLAEAAEELGWTLGTARSASKQLFARMGTASQAGVVRRLLESGVWLG
ncbi:helix-turn-helix transcriptional regulator, partial [Mangrovicoccus algicola]